MDSLSRKDKGARYKTVTCPHCKKSMEYDANDGLGRCQICNQLFETPPESNYAGTHDSTSVSLTPAFAVKEPRQRISTGFKELDRVLGGGLVLGTVVLLTGRQGIGKATFAMQIAANIGRVLSPAIYVTCEQSLSQAGSRAERVCGDRMKDLGFFAENNIEKLIIGAQRNEGKFMVMDHLQLLVGPNPSSRPNTKSTHEEVLDLAARASKDHRMSFMVVAHSERNRARTLPIYGEFLANVKLDIDDETLPGFLVVRAIRSDCGPTNEIGSFLMTEHGIVETEEPSKKLIENGDGVIAVSMFGTRPLATRIQVSNAPSGDRKNCVVGFPEEKLRQIQGTLEQTGIDVPSAVSLKVLSGYKFCDPSADLAVAVAIARFSLGFSVQSNWAALGELDLKGVVRPFPRLGEMFKELEKIGVENIVVPAYGSSDLTSARCKIHRVYTVQEALQLFGVDVPSPTGAPPEVKLGVEPMVEVESKPKEKAVVPPTPKPQPQQIVEYAKKVGRPRLPKKPKKKAAPLAVGRKLSQVSGPRPQFDAHTVPVAANAPGAPALVEPETIIGEPPEYAKIRQIAVEKGGVITGMDIRIALGIGFMKATQIALEFKKWEEERVKKIQK